MCVYERCLDICKTKRGLVVFPDGEDARAVSAATRLAKEGLVSPILLGRPYAVQQELRRTGMTGTMINVIDPLTPSIVERNAQEYIEIRRAKGKNVTDEEAIKAMACPLACGAFMVRRGEVEVGIAGNLSSTANVLRAGLNIIGTAQGVKTVSSFFFMISPDCGKLYVFADCGVIPDPTPEQTVDIAYGAASTLKNLMGIEPKVALLSFSTKGSAKHERVDKVKRAFELITQKYPDLKVDGELQFDAAIVPSVAKLKSPGSKIAGNANVFIFPSLEAGNIGYKIAQRLGGYTAFGPLLQGFAGGWHDLSRGCSADDMLQMAVIGLGLQRTRNTQL